MKRMFLEFLILVATWSTLVGCGSGSGNETPAVGKTRALQAGDSWTYDVSGEVHGTQYSGTSTVTLKQEIMNGMPLIAATTVLNYTFNGSNISVTSVEYYQQDAVGRNITLYGRKFGSETMATVIDNPLPVVWPGTWETGKVIPGEIRFSDGSVDTGSYTVTGQETITTPAGTFSTWKCMPSSGSGTIWFSPEVGNYIKNKSDMITHTLRSTTVTGF